MTRSVSRIQARNTKPENLNELRKLARSKHTTFRHNIGKKGIYNRRILIDATFGQHDYIFHATKGWRRRRRTGAL